MKENRYLTFALAKGRLANKTLELLERLGITCEEMKDKDSRKLIFVNEEQKLKFFLSKGPDVPTYVEYGAADTKYWTLDSVSAGCASADLKRQGSFYGIMRGFGWRRSIR